MDRPATANPATAREIILEIVRNMREGLEPLHYTTLPPAIFHVYLHPDDMERLRGIVPRIVDEARRALDAEVEALNRASLAERLKLIASRDEPKIVAPGRRLADSHSREHRRRRRAGRYRDLLRAGAAGEGRFRRRVHDQADRHPPHGRRARPSKQTLRRRAVSAPGAARRAPRRHVRRHRVRGQRRPQDVRSDQGPDRGRPRRPRLLDRSQAGNAARRFARAFPPAPRSRDRPVFPEGPEPPGHHHQRREGAIQHRIRGRREARPQRRGAGAGEGAHRPGGRPLPGVPKHVPMVKTMLKCAGASDPGRVRSNNEDACYIDAERGIFLVVDGIGGQAAGEKAAEIAVERVRARLERQTGTTEQRIREAITMANNEILRAAQAQSEWEGMACVLTLAVLENGLGGGRPCRRFAPVPDSRRRDSQDHARPFAGGRARGRRRAHRGEAMRHPRRNEVFRDVGSEEHAPDDPDFIEVQRIPFDPIARCCCAATGSATRCRRRRSARRWSGMRGDPGRGGAGADRGGQSRGRQGQRDRADGGRRPVHARPCRAAAAAGRGLVRAIAWRAVARGVALALPALVLRERCGACRSRRCIAVPRLIAAFAAIAAAMARGAGRRYGRRGRRRVSRAGAPERRSELCAAGSPLRGDAARGAG